MDELQLVIQEINALATDGFSASVVADSLKSNFYIFLGPGVDYARQFPLLVKSCPEQTGGYSIFLFDVSNEIYRGNMYVDVDRASNVQSAELLKEIILSEK